MQDFVEQRIISAIKGLLSGRVNEILGEMEFSVPPVEFGDYGNSVSPLISLSTCERSEKERIVRLDAYSLSITFSLYESKESEMYCYAYAFAVCKAVGENPTLGGVADRAVVTGKKYAPPKKAHCGQGWEVAISLRVTVEGAQ